MSTPTRVINARIEQGLCDLVVENGAITEITAAILGQPAGESTFDAEGRAVLPGFVD